MKRGDAKVLLEVRGLRVRVGGVEIVKGLDLTVRAGEVHAVMGPNGSGKSTFAKAVVGHPLYEVTGGTIDFEGRNLFDLAPEERARAGLFLGFQYPVEIPGVSNSAFLRLAYNSVQAARGRDELDPLEFDDVAREKMKALGMENDVGLTDVLLGSVTLDEAIQPSGIPNLSVLLSGGSFRLQVHQGKIAGATAEVGDQHQFFVSEPLLIFVGGSDRLGKKPHLIEAGVGEGSAQPTQRELIIRVVPSAAEMYRTTGDQSRAEIAELGFRGFSEVAQKDANQFL